MSSFSVRNYWASNYKYSRGYRTLSWRFKWQNLHL